MVLKEDDGRARPFGASAEISEVCDAPPRQLFPGICSFPFSFRRWRGEIIRG